MKVITNKRVIKCIEQLGYNPYHCINGIELVECNEGDKTSFRTMQGGMCAPISDFAYPVYRFDQDKLLKLLDDL